MFSPTNSSLKILYWNANGLHDKIIELYDTLTTTNTHIACISETHLLSTDHLHSHPDYHIIHVPRIDTDRRAGGVAIILRRNIRYTLHHSPRTTLLEAVGIRIHLQSGKPLNVYSVYLPGGASRGDIQQHFSSDINKLIRQVQKNYFICGDLNAKHRFWNCVRANKASQILYDEYCRHQFFIFHPDTPTHFPSATNSSPSTIDLMLSDGGFEMSDLTCDEADSDHNLVSFEIITDSSVSEADMRKIPCFKNADWNNYQNVVSVISLTLRQLMC